MVFGTPTLGGLWFTNRWIGCMILLEFQFECTRNVGPTCRGVCNGNIWEPMLSSIPEMPALPRPKALSQSLLMGKAASQSPVFQPKMWGVGRKSWVASKTSVFGGSWEVGLQRFRLDVSWKVGASSWWIWRSYVRLIAPSARVPVWACVWFLPEWVKMNLPEWFIPDLLQLDVVILVVWMLDNLWPVWGDGYTNSTAPYEGKVLNMFTIHLMSCDIDWVPRLSLKLAGIHIADSHAP